MRRPLSIAVAMLLVLIRIALVHGHHPAQAIAATPPAPASFSENAGPWALNPAPAAASPGNTRSTAQPTVLTRDGSGQFHLTASVDGHDTRFLVDTGADLVALTVDDAARLGIVLAPNDFRPMLRTASGTANAAPVRLDRLEVAGSELNGVDAVVVQGLGVNLLGQSALRRLGKVELQGDELRFEPG